MTKTNDGLFFGHRAAKDTSYHTMPPEATFDVHLISFPPKMNGERFDIQLQTPYALVEQRSVRNAGLGYDNDAKVRVGCRSNTYRSRGFDLFILLFGQTNFHV